MNVKIVFLPDGRWNGGGTLPPHLKDISDLSAWIRGFLAEVTDLRKKYVAAVGSDGRLVGQEKANIAIEMDDIIGGLLLFRRYLAGGPAHNMAAPMGKMPAPAHSVADAADPAHIPADSDPDTMTSAAGSINPFAVRLLDNTWNGYGKLGRSRETDGLTFGAMHNDIILNRVRDLFTSYGKAVADRVITPAERSSLTDKVDDLFTSLLLIERELLQKQMER